MPEFIRAILARIIAAWVAGMVTWLAVKYGVTMDSKSQLDLVEHIVGIVIPILLTVYSIAHKALNKHINPGDSASSHMISNDLVLHDELKSEDK